MKIIYKDVVFHPMGSIPSGDCFELEEDLYIISTAAFSDYKKCIRLRDGKVKNVKTNLLVKKVNVNVMVS